MMEKKYEHPEILYKIFPLIFIFYKPKKSRPRRLKTGVKVVRSDRFARGWGLQNTYGRHRKKATQQQNDYAFVTCLILTPDGYGTVRRSLRHKGYSKVVAAVYPTDEEIAREKSYWRFVFRKYKTAGEIYNCRQWENPEWKSICERLDNQYPSHSTGQLRLL